MPPSAFKSYSAIENKTAPILPDKISGADHSRDNSIEPDEASPMSSNVLSQTQTAVIGQLNNNKQAEDTSYSFPMVHMKRSSAFNTVTDASVSATTNQSVHMQRQMKKKVEIQAVPKAAHSPGYDKFVSLSQTYNVSPKHFQKKGLDLSRHLEPLHATQAHSPKNKDQPDHQLGDHKKSKAGLMN